MGILYNQTNLSFNLINVQVIDTPGTTEFSLDNSVGRYLSGVTTPGSQISLADFRGKQYGSVYSAGVNTSVYPGSPPGYQFVHRGIVFTLGDTAYNYIGVYIDQGYTDLTYLSAMPIPQIGYSSLSDLSSPTAIYYSQFDTRISLVRVTADYTSITIKAWGGGGGSGGSWSSGTPGNGGAGGYATTTLTVGTDIFVGQILHFIPGFGGAGGTSVWYAGTGGWASAVYVTDGAWAYPQSTTDWSNANYTSKFNASNCVLVAGGGGGGGCINWSVGSAGSGGGGGSVNSGSAGFYSGSGTGATTTAHGQGAVSSTAGSVIGIPGGGVDKSSSVSSTQFFNEATWASLATSCVLTAANSTDMYPALIWLGPSCGGGGAFSGTGGPAHIVDLGQTGARTRGGGGGSSKVYRGTGSTQTSGISSTPPQGGGSSFGQGYGGVGKGPQNPNVANRYAGKSGTGGLILISFNA